MKNKMNLKFHCKLFELIFKQKISNQYSTLKIFTIILYLFSKLMGRYVLYSMQKDVDFDNYENSDNNLKDKESTKAKNIDPLETLLKGSFGKVGYNIKLIS